MPFVYLVIGLALLEFLFFCGAVGRARGTYKVPAPATTGNEMFERYFRVQMNTLELLVVFIPSICMFGYYVSPYVGAALGALFIIGRLVYFASYLKDPKSRSLGYGLSVLPIMILLVGGMIGALRAAAVFGHS
jgi:glutathione S-transferase